MGYKPHIYLYAGSWWVETPYGTRQCYSRHHAFNIAKMLKDLI